MITIIAEKPSQARNFAAALGGMSGAYNGEPYQIVASRGHLYEFVQNPRDMVEKAERSEKLAKWDPFLLPFDFSDFTWKKKLREGMGSVITAIKQACRVSDEVCIATDDDPTFEGQMIGWEILYENNIHPKRVSRMYFADESAKSVQDAFVNRVMLKYYLDDLQCAAAYFRSRFDYLSMQLTRIATYCAGFPKTKAGKVIPVRTGRLKGAMTVVVGDQLKAIANYKRIPTYSNRFRDENGVVYINKDEPEFADKSLVPMTYKPSDVIQDSCVHKMTSPKPLLNLAQLAGIMERKYGVNSKTTLDTYQSMYQAQRVSYPRTEDKAITIEQFNDLLPHVDAICELVGVDKRLISYRQPRKTHVKSGMAHGANRPGTNVPHALSELDQYGQGAREIYVLLAKSYLAMLSPDYEYDSYTGHLAQYPKFIGKVSICTKRGWRDVFDVSGDEPDSDKGLGHTAKPFVHEGFPPRPQTPTQEWLYKQLEKYDIGTGATQVSTFSEMSNARVTSHLFDVKKGKISLSPIGDMCYNLIQGTDIADLGVTASILKDMKDVAAGIAEADDLLPRISDIVRHDRDVMFDNAAKCGYKKGFSTMGKTTLTYQGQQYDVWDTFMGQHQWTEDELKRLGQGEKIVVSDLVSKRTSNTYAIYAQFNPNGSWVDKEGKNHTGPRVENMGFVDDRPVSFQNHTFSDAEVEKLLNGDRVHVTGLVSKKTGKNYDCDMTWNPGTKRLELHFD